MRPPGLRPSIQIFHGSLLISLLLAAAGYAQTSAPTSTPGQSSPSAPAIASGVNIAMPKDPAAILDVAAKVNGLSGPGVRPWHIKLSYETFDDKGHSEDSGVYEEFWISERNYRRSYASPKFNQTDFATDKGLYRSGDQKWPANLEVMLRNDLIEPVPMALDLHGFRLENNRRSLNKLEFRCVTLTADWIFPATNGYCFQEDQPILRFANSAGDRNAVLYNQIVTFQGRFVARDIRVTKGGQPRLVVHVETIEGLATTENSDFAPPPDAVHIAGDKTKISEDTVRAFLLRQVPPHYPMSAKANHIEGKVSLQITIGKDGRVSDAQVISGASELRKPAIDAVRQWEYRPFLVGGEPTEVETTIEITFTLGS